MIEYNTSKFIKIKLWRDNFKKKRERKNLFDKSLFQLISVDNEKKILRENNAIEYEQLISIARNVDINSKSSLFGKFVVIKDSRISWFLKWFSIA